VLVDHVDGGGRDRGDVIRELESRWNICSDDSGEVQGRWGQQGMWVCATLAECRAVCQLLGKE
jgi:hypothetical protein